jgi:ABC-2 type transport system permease protein
MPKPHVWFAQIMPFTHFIDAYLKIGVMGSSFSDAIPEIIRLSLFVLISAVITLAILTLRKRGLKGTPEEVLSKEAIENV